ncbi:Ig-like domain-containing protein [Nocardioides sp.]|uniref:Ig-like domain-containing protein n=1 Tax=Nocardioides sp. TaxID=35761 RepID=UPI001A23C4AA|nr:Ig-like domain-containing protein [Nocardioides sp.]MBJ7356794.1 Ig-like domain repeat protein [Nocardioides sp.]
MTRVVTLMVLSLAVALSGLVLASPASAVVTPVSYQVALTDPVMSTPLGTDSSCTPGSGGPAGYKVVRFTVSATASYTVTDNSGANDGRIGIYTGPFSPTSPATNCLAFVDVSETVALSAGAVYTMVQSHAPAGAGTGAFSFNFDGAGTPTVLTPTSTTLTTNPNPSELSKATTLRAVVAGGATPTGTVQFHEGATLLGSAPLSGGVARLDVSSLAVGNHTLSATYTGDATHDVSAGVQVHKVQYGPKPKVKLWVSDRTPYVGQKIKLSWVSTGADKLKAGGDWHGKRPKKGSKRITIKSLGFHAYKLKATNVNGKARAKVKVVAQRAPAKLTVAVPDEFVTVNTLVRVRADGLDARERFKIFLDDDLLAKGFADRRGDVSALVRIPRGTEEGEYTLTVMGSNKDRVGSTPVLVLAPKKLDVEVTKKKLKVGGTQTVKVAGLLEGESVTVTYLGEVLVEGKADAQGEFEYAFPVGDEPGKATVKIEGGVPSRVGEAKFEVFPGAGADS